MKDRKLEDRLELKEGLSEGELSGLYSRSKFVIRLGYGEYESLFSVIETI